MTVKTRFAPSPTGMLHIGNVRTALFAWLYARHNHGEFILRIEDTDRERSTEESIQSILESMQWLGLDYDAGPFYQTDRYDRYKMVADQLLAEGKAYRCYCTKERLEALRENQMKTKEKPRYDGHCRNLTAEESSPFVLRFKNPQEGVVSFTDQVYGDIHVQNQELDDLILIRSDGHPTYNFAVVIDDSDMEITHVIRGDDHINNTPRQINLYKAINAAIPQFAHLPMILGEDGKRFSKRHGAVGVLEFKNMGILPHALLNYLARLGWSHGDQEIFSPEELISKFDLNGVSRGVSCFNFEKLYWMNQHYQRSEPAEEVAKALAWYFEQEGIDISEGPDLATLVTVQAERCKNLAEMCKMSLYFYTDTVEYDEKAVEKFFNETIQLPLTALYNRLKNIQTWEKEALQGAVNDTCAEFNLNMGKIAQPLRVAITGNSISPSIDLTLTLLGKNKTLSRMEKALTLMQ